MKKGSALVASVTVYHYSRLSVGLAAAVMTAASSIGLMGVLRPRAAIVVGLGTSAAYWFDDLVDLIRDEERNPALRTMRAIRLGFLISGLGAAALGMIWILPGEPRKLFLLLGALTGLTIAYCVRHAFVGPRRLTPTRYWTQAVGWSAACVLSPQLEANRGTTPQTWMALSFFCLLMFPVIDLWRKATPQPRALVRSLAVQCIAASLLVLMAVSFRWFPWFNLALLAAPAINLLLLWVRECAVIGSRAIFSELAVGFNTLCGLLVIGANSSGLRLRQLGPRSPQDYVQLAAVIALAAIIGGNLMMRRSRDEVLHREDSFSAIVTLGFAVFAFQALQSACHFQGWLLPWFSTRLFDLPGAQRAGGAMLAVSIIVFAVSYRQMGSAWRIGIDEKAHGALVVSGLFRRSRNPIFLAGNLFIAGSFLLNPTLSGLLYLVFTPLVLHAQILREENFLRSVYGSQYTNYASKTPRYL